MDSHHVNKHIREHIRPGLKKHGFTEFTARSAWRQRPDRIDVVNFQSFNSYLAESVGCTTYSFSVNLGCFLTYIPGQRPNIKEKDGLLLPEEYDCPLRARLERTFKQKELQRTDIWYIDPGGKYLIPALHDVNQQIHRVALPWFDRLSDDEEILRILLEEPEDMDNLWGFGSDPSPIRAFLTGYAALQVGRRDLAKTKLREAYETECFPALREQIKTDLAKL